MIAAKREGKTIAGYGAAGKTNTLLNYCGIGRTSSSTRSIAIPTSRASSFPAP